jgi:hypothetical protein
MEIAPLSRWPRERKGIELAGGSGRPGQSPVRIASVGCSCQRKSGKNAYRCRRENHAEIFKAVNMVNMVKTVNLAVSFSHGIGTMPAN